MIGLNSASREDFRVYYQCPKIVAINAYRILHPPPRPKQPQARRQPDVPAAVVGALGEVGIQQALAEDVDVGDDFEDVVARRLSRAVGTGRVPIEPDTPRATFQGLLADLDAPGHSGRTGAAWERVPKIDLSPNVTALIRAMAPQLKAVRARLEEHYGSVRILTKGQYRFGAAMGQGQPDFVAETKAGRRLFIENKNSATASTTLDRFQATWYNTLSAVASATLAEQGSRQGQTTLRPEVWNDAPVETVLTYSQLGRAEPITAKLERFDEARLGIWEAKQLGLRGQWPDVTCRPGCAHEKRAVTLGPGSLHPDAPLSAVAGLALVDAGADLERRYFDVYIGGLLGHDVVSDLRRAYRHFEGTRLATKRIALVSALSEYFGMDEPTAKAILGQESEAWPSAEGIAAVDDSVGTQWRKTLGSKRYQSQLARARAQAYKVFPLPEGSARFVKRTVRLWDR